MEEDKKCDECNLKCLIYCALLDLLIPITWILLSRRFQKKIVRIL